MACNVALLLSSLTRPLVANMVGLRTALLVFASLRLLTAAGILIWEWTR